jgi:hypothetical protein
MGVEILINTDKFVHLDMVVSTRADTLQVISGDTRSKILHGKTICTGSWAVLIHACFFPPDTHSALRTWLTSLLLLDRSLRG